MLPIISAWAGGVVAQPGFTKHVLTSDFISEGVAVADVNLDGQPDIIAGAFWFAAPGWVRHELASPPTFSTTEYSNSCLNFRLDVNRSEERRVGQECVSTGQYRWRRYQ